MTVKEFVEKYNNAKNKDACFKEVITTYYASIGAKQIIAQATLNKNIATADNGVVYINKFVEKINLTFAMFTLYTNIEMANSKKLYEDYDLLVSNDLPNRLTSLIGKDVDRFVEVYNLLVSNWESYSKTTEAVLYSIVDIAAKSFENIGENIIKIIESKDFSDNLSKVMMNG